MNFSFDNLVLLGIAGLNAFTAYQTMKARREIVETKEIAQKTEINTNSMKDALVKSTMDSAHAAGREEGRVEGEMKAAAVAEGRLAVMSPALPLPVDNPVPVKIRQPRKRKSP